MSARPRPITATVNPPLTSTPLHGPRTFLSSDGSTESLVSILDHESYESHTFSDEEDEQTTERTDPATTTEVTSPTPAETDGRLTPWEKWMVQKAKEIRIHQKQEIAKLKKLKAEQEKKEQEKAQKQVKCDKNVQEWNERKIIEITTREKMEKRTITVEKELKEAEKKLIEDKAKVNFEDWQYKKKKAEKEQKRKEIEKKREEERLEAERKEKAELKYQEWLKQAKHRPKSAPHSFGYTAGKLTSYYDRCTYPAPSFYNPLPWQPIPVPNQTERKARPKPKKNVRKRFNPSKYL